MVERNNRDNANKNSLAILIPGIGYSLERPLLYYSRKLAEKANYDICSITYENRISFDRDIKSEREKAFYGYFVQVERQLDKVEFDKYDNILFITKSIGTVLMAKYTEKYHLKTNNIVYTPLEETFDYELGKGICVSGTKDPWLEHSIYLEKIKNTSLKNTVIEDANHSLETGFVTNDILNLNMIMKESERVINNLVDVD